MWRTLIIAMLILAGMSPARSAEVFDDAGNRVTLDQPAQRIISLAPSLTEIIYAAGAGDKLVGVVAFSDYPEAASRLPLVGRHDLLDLELILQLQPDLIVAWQTGNPHASVIRLKQLGLTVYIAEPKSLESIPSHIERLARLAGTETAASNALGSFRTTLSRLRDEYAATSPVSVFYQVWNQPLISAGGNELINDIIELCGGSNIFADIKLVAPKVSMEAVLQRNPDVIIASGMDIERPEWLDEWKNWPGLNAVSNNSLFFIPPDLLQRHTPRALLGAEQMCSQLAQARLD